MLCNINILLIDIGNTLIKIYNNEDLLVRIASSIDLKTGIKSLENLNLDIDIDKVVVCSVKSSGDALIEAWAKKHKIKILRFGVDIDVNMPNKYSKPNKLGLDRQLMSLAFINRFANTGTIISMGTVITIDYIDNGLHIGGQIAPSLKLLVNSLVTNTGALPLVDLKEENTNLSSTEGAISVGCYNMHINYIDTQLHQALKRGKVIISGGDGFDYAQQNDLEYSSNLIAQGMLIAYKEQYDKTTKQ